MPKALCLFSLVASILIVCLFSADAVMGMVGARVDRAAERRKLGDGPHFCDPRRDFDLSQLGDLPRAALDRSAVETRPQMNRPCIDPGIAGIVQATGLVVAGSAPNRRLCELG